MLQLSLRELNHDSRSAPSERTYASQQIKTMMQKEKGIYKCNDYILSHKLERKVKAPKKWEPSSSCAEDFVVDEQCRQKMCEWSYRIVDHFDGNRALVAIAQNYVDRFLDQYRW